MKVLNARSALLADYEVLSLLQQMEADQQRNAPASQQMEEKMAKVPQNLRTIQYEILSTLTQPYRPAIHQEAVNIRSFHTALKQAGFIGGRRAYQDHYSHPASTSSSTATQSAQSPDNAPSKRKTNNTNSGRTKGKRYKKDDAGDASMRSPTPPPLPPSTATMNTYDPDQRGPDEILPDRALTKAERLQLVNNAPRSLVELHTLIEELGERFTEAQISELLHLANLHIPVPPTEDEVASGILAQSLEEQDQGYDEAEGEGLDDPADGSAVTAAKDNGLFIGGMDDETYVYDGEGAGEEQDDDDFVNDANGRGGDDLAGEGGNDDEE